MAARYERSKSTLSSFVKKGIDNVKQKYLSNLGIGSPKYVETLKMFESLSKIADGLCGGVESDDEFTKLQHRVVNIHALAVREISVWHTQILRRLRRTAFVKTGWAILLVRDVPCKIFDHILDICTANTSFATTVVRTNKDISVKFTDVRKVMYIFKYCGIIGNLSKDFKNLGKAKVITSEEKSFQLFYKKRNEQLKVTCHFGFWNSHGIPQF